MGFIYAGIGGMLGACLRFGLGAFINKKAASTAPFPAGTWVINLTGSFLLGILANRHLAGSLSETAWLLWGVGFCGAYTTFSTFGTETVGLLDKKRFKLAAIYVTSSVLFGLLFAMLGFIL